jgi:hypothetical protein
MLTYDRAAGYGLVGEGTDIRFRGRARDCSVLHSGQIGSGTQPFSYTTSTGGGGVQGCEVAYGPAYSAVTEEGGGIPPLPQTSSWRDA